MYKHLLVPLDDTPLSAANVGHSVELARSLGARITFFHATADLAATGEGSLLLTLDPGAFAQAAPGATHAVLTKAMAAARGAGVASSAAARTCDHPAEAIVQAAQAQGCDLIVMASRGPSASPWRSWVHNSQTERVLRHAPVALLVTRVAAEQPLSDRERAVGIIIDEHRSIAVVVGAMRDIANEWVQSRASNPDTGDLAGMVAYLHQFPERMHHPKEEEHLHRRMRARDASCAALLEDIEAQHEVERRLIDRVSACLDAATGTDGVRNLQDAVLRFADHVFAHLKLEEGKVLQMAQQSLGNDDWTAIADAFSSNDDGRFGELSSAEFRRLFTQVANGIAARGRPG